MTEPMPVTTSTITAESGSRRSDQGTVKAPMPDAVASGIGGIQVPSTASKMRPPSGRASSWPQAQADRPNAPAIAAHPTTAACVRLNHRMPNRPLSAAPAAGRRGMSQSSVIDGSPPQHVHLVEIDRLLVAVEREDDPQSDGRLGGGDGDDEDREHLPGGVVKLVRERREVDVHGV